MVICRKPLLLLTDAFGALGLCGLAALTMLAGVLPAQRAAAELPRVQAERERAQDIYSAATDRNRVAAERLAALEQYLADESARQVADIGRFLEYLSDGCTAARIRLHQVQPQVIVDDATRRTWDVQVRAGGKFPDFEALLSRLESWSAYLQVRDFSAIGPPAGGTTGDCEFIVTLRIHYVHPLTAVEPAPK